MTGTSKVLRIKMVYVERKEFAFDWCGPYGRSLVAMTERSQKKLVHDIISKDYVIWLAAIPRKFGSDATGKEGLGGEMAGARWWRDQKAAVLITGCSNSSGRFVKLEIYPPKEKQTVICFPTGQNSGGWTVLADSMARFVGVFVKESGPLTIDNEHRVEAATDGGRAAVPSFAKVVKGKEEEVRGN